MWEEGESSLIHGGPSDSSVTYHVLLVDPDKECLISTARMLEFCSYKVTVIELASTALLMLEMGNERFDLIMADVRSTDMINGFQLLDEAIKMNVPVILTSGDTDAGLARRAIEEGASFFIPKPLTVDILMYMWQIVLREKKRMLRENALLGNIAHEYNTRPNGFIPRGRLPREENRTENNTRQRGVYITRRTTATGQPGRNDEGDTELQSYGVRRKTFLGWTDELHSKFMDAVETLGEGRCYPKDIWELMNVPGLTRMQVASHLQKCRNNNWQLKRNKNKCTTTNQAQSSVNFSPSRNYDRRFGAKPLNIGNSQLHPVEIHDDDHTIPPQLIQTSSGNNNIVRDEISSEQVYRPQIHLEPGYLNGDTSAYDSPIRIVGQLEPIGTSSAALSLGIPRNGVGSSINGVVQNEIISSGVVQNEISNGVVQNEIIPNGVVQNEISNGVVQNEIISDGVVENEISSGVVQNDISNTVETLASGPVMITHPQFEPMMPAEPTIAAPAGTDWLMSSSTGRQPTDDFFDIDQDMDYILTDINIRPKNSMTTSNNMESKGQWS